jgi:hypothetical protein
MGEAKPLDPVANDRKPDSIFDPLTFLENVALQISLDELRVSRWRPSFVQRFWFIRAKPWWRESGTRKRRIFEASSRE